MAHARKAVLLPAAALQRRTPWTSAAVDSVVAGNSLPASSTATTRRARDCSLLTDKVLMPAESPLSASARSTAVFSRQSSSTRALSCLPSPEILDDDASVINVISSMQSVVRRSCSHLRVRFESPAVGDFYDITPYSEFYGVHPDHFNFDASGNMVSTDWSPTARLEKAGVGRDGWNSSSSSSSSPKTSED